MFAMLLNFLLVFLIGSAEAESSAPDFVDLIDDHEAAGIDLAGHPLDLGQLGIGHDGQDDFLLIALVAALAVENGDAAVHLGQDGLTDSLVFVGDDHDLGLAGTQQQLKNS